MYIYKLYIHSQHHAILDIWRCNYIWRMFICAVTRNRQLLIFFLRA